MEVRRIRTVLFFFASIFLFSCQGKEDNRLAVLTLQAACNDKWAEIEDHTGSLEAVTYKAGGRKADLRVLAQSKRIAKWKKSAIPKLSIPGLKQYADSLIFWNKTKGQIPTYSSIVSKNDPANSVLSNIQDGKIAAPTKLNTLADSLRYYELLYLLMRKEFEFQSWLSAKVIGPWSYNASTSKLKYAVNDTVKLISSFKFYGMDEGDLLHFRVKSLQITFQDKPTNIVPSVEFIGKYVILKFIVRQKGTYFVNGIITGTYPESRKEELAHTVNQHIRVE